MHSNVLTVPSRESISTLSSDVVNIDLTTSNPSIKYYWLAQHIIPPFKHPIEY
jgi:hypothetical protein